jgi:hypothetical protein
MIYKTICTQKCKDRATLTPLQTEVLRKVKGPGWLNELGSWIN